MNARALPDPEEIALPPVELRHGASVESALEARRSERQFGPEALPLAALGQLLWAAQGLTSPEGGRTAPSAGALYPLELYLAAGRVDDLPAGVYRYAPASHSVRLHLAGDCRDQLADAALEQSAVRGGAAVLVIAAVRARTSAKYGSRAKRYVHMEAGHAAQNVYLQAVSLGLGTLVVGAFDDRRVKGVLRLPAGTAPLALMPVGARP